MQISGEAMAGIVGGLVLGIFGAYRVVITMREQIKTLFNKVEEIKKEKDSDIEKLESKIEKIYVKIDDLKDDIQSVRASQIEGTTNLSDMMNALHIKLLEKMSEKTA